MISSLLKNEADLGVEQTKLALVILNTIRNTMADPRLNKNTNNRPRYSSVSSEDNNQSSVTEDGEDSSSYSTAEEDQIDSNDPVRAFREAPHSDGSDDTMKSAVMDVLDARESSMEDSTGEVPPIPMTPSAKTPISSRRASVEEKLLKQRSGEDILISTRGTKEPDRELLEGDPHDEVQSSGWKSPAAQVAEDFTNPALTINVSHLQRLFDCFKLHPIEEHDCINLLGVLKVSQKRDDFQWALHQMGGFNAILFLYGRVVEICEDDSVQAKCLSLVLTQMKSQKKFKEGQEKPRKELIRFLLSSSKSVFGFQTFMTLIRSCLNPKGNRLEDYELLNLCLLSSWKRLLHNRCSENDAPTGSRTLFECLLQIVLDLCVESGPYRDLNVGVLKAYRFTETLLSICSYLVQESLPAHVDAEDALRISTCVKSILGELMAPPDGTLALSFIRFGLLPLLPRELPPLAQKQTGAFFLYHRSQSNPISNFSKVVEGEEVYEDENPSRRQSVVSEYGDEPPMRIEEDIPELIGFNNGSFPTKPNNDTDEGVSVEEESSETFLEAFRKSLLEGIMSILLNSISILPDDCFRKLLEANAIAPIFLAYSSHPNVTLKSLGLQLLTAYLNRVKNPIATDFIKSHGFFLASMYTQGNPELAHVVLQICTEFGPFSYALVNGLIYSNQILNTVIQWIQHDESGVVPSLLSMGFLPSVMNHYTNNQQLPRPLVTLLNVITKFLVLNPKDDMWKVLFCPGIESAPHSNYIASRILQDATETLRRYTGKDLKKSEVASRLLWLMERCSCTRIGHQFDKWLLKIYAVNLMEMDDSEESEGWRYFVKKHRRRLNYLCGLFLCRIFATNQGDFDFKQYAIRCLILSCSNLPNWLPKVIRSDDQIERCFTAFIRVFMSDAETRQCGRMENRIRRPSFHSLISTNNGNLVFTLRTAAAVGLPNDLNESPQHISHSQSISDIDVHLSDRAIRSRFENILVGAGVLSPTNNFANSRFNSSNDFKTFKILLEATPISGVSHSELRQCLTTIEKMRIAVIAKSSVRRSNSFTTIKIQNNPSSIPLLTISNSASYFDSIFESVYNFSVEVQEIVTAMRNEQEVEVARRVSVHDADVKAKESWWRIRQSLSHPKAPWHFESSYPKFWSLEQSEGPSRVRSRLRKEPLKISNRFLKPEYQEQVTSPQPLDFLFQYESREYLHYPVLQSEVEFIRFCVRIVPGEELPGEVILSGDNLYFFCEACHLILDHCDKVKVPRAQIYQILRRRYMLEDRAAEVFVQNQSYFFVFRTQKDREDFVHVFSAKTSTSTFGNKSFLLNSSLTTVTSQWVKGNVSNFDYLMYLNTAAGRTYCDLMQYPVFPFVLAKYETPQLDLRVPASYRDLRKPMAVQDPSKEDHFISTYNYLKRECDSTPFHYGSHYSNSGIVLHFLVRLPPYTQHFLKYQDGSFDIPDRSFHSIETTWNLASKDSNTDFKEAIPEFFYLPEFLQNLLHFDLGVRQNECRVDDVELPPWAKGNSRIFTLVNRQALESQEVRKHLGDWIDLIFGYKQTGKPAIQAINVFHPSTYEGFEVDGDGADDVIQKARKAMVSTYGQMPRRLFPIPHPKPQIQRSESCDKRVIDSILGVQWGTFLGSPSSPDLDVISTRDYQDPVELFETTSRIVFWPERTLILGDSVVGSWDSSGVRIRSIIVYLCVGDEITTCTGTESKLWLGHQSGRILVLTLSSTMDEVVESVELVGHYQPIKHIDLNQDFSVAISCSGESYAIVWDMNRMAYTNVIENGGAVHFVYSSRLTGDVVLLNKDQNYVSMKTINGFPIGEIRPDEKIESVCISSLDPGKNVNLIAIGCNYGLIRFYSTWDLRFVSQIKVVPIWSLPIKSIRYSRDARRLYCLSHTEGKHITVALQLSSQQKKLL